MPVKAKNLKQDKTFRSKTVRVSSPKLVKPKLTVDVYGVTGKKTSTFELPKEIFGAKVNKILMAQAVRVYLSNQRLGTSSTKSRGQVQGSSRKIYRQKGTGRARHGSIRAPIFVKGGIAFGPKPRDHSLKLPKKMKKVALNSALTSKLADGQIKIISGFEKIEPKTRIIAGFLKTMSKGESKENILLVTDGTSENVYRASRNIAGLKTLPASFLNTYEVLNNNMIYFMKQAISQLDGKEREDK